MKKIMICAALLVSGAVAAFAQSGSTNNVTPAERAKAEAAVKAAGYVPGAVSTAQGGSIFINATKDGQRYLGTVAGDGKFYPGIASKPMFVDPEVLKAGLAGRGGRGGGGVASGD